MCLVAVYMIAQAYSLAGQTQGKRIASRQCCRYIEVVKVKRLSILFLAVGFGGLLAQAGVDDAPNSPVAKVSIVSDEARAKFALDGARHAYRVAVNQQTNQYETAWQLCRALIDAGTLTKGRVAQKLLFVESEQLARHAVKINSTDSKGHLYLSISVGKLALFEGGKRKVELSKEVKTEAEQAIALDPAEDAAYHVLGIWNREVFELNLLLKKFAELLYGNFPQASLEAAQSNFRRAVELAPTVVSHRVELGLTLLAAGKRMEGHALLEEALRMPETWVTDDYYKAIARKNL